MRCDYMGGALVPGGTQEVLRSRTVTQATEGLNKSPPTLKIFVVNSDPVPGGHLVDTERFPKLGYIASAPSLELEKVQEVTLEEGVFTELTNQPRPVWSFRIVLDRKDAPLLRSMTETNIGNKLLIMIGDELAAAPVLTTPLKTGNFVIDTSDRAVMQLLKERFASMPREGP